SSRVYMEDLDPYFDPHSWRQVAHLAREKPSCSLYPGQRNCVTYIFLIDIKLALGNNPHHFFALLLERSCRLHQPYSVFCCSAVIRTSRVSSSTPSKMHL